MPTAASLNTTAINVACAASIHATETTNCASFELYVGGHTEVTLLVEYTRDAATVVTMHVDGSKDGSAPWGIQQMGDGSVPPAVTIADQTVPKSVSASTAWLVTVEKITTPWVRFRFVGTSATANDTVKVWVFKMGP